MPGAEAGAGDGGDPPVTARVSKQEAVRQLRARAAELIENAAQAALDQLPEDVEVGHAFAIVLPLTVEEPSIPDDLLCRTPVRCDGRSCPSAMEFAPFTPAEESRRRLEERGWGMMGGLLLCRRCRTAPSPSSS